MFHFLVDIHNIMCTLSIELQHWRFHTIAIVDIEDQFLHHVIMDLSGFEKNSNNYLATPKYGTEK